MKQIIHLIVFIILTNLLTAGEMVPFVIPARVHPASQIAMEASPLTAQDRLSAGEHFVDAAGGRVRLWGVNLSFGANFPTHADAEHIAARMAAFGVNSVRFHHMDTDNWPRGIWDETGRGLHPEALDRLDYFINQLALHGIYANLNLHVGKKYSVQLDIPDSPTDYDKMVNLFTPELIAAQKAFARNLLTHQNPYRNGMPYAEDYAVAIVEITNENSLFMWGAENTLRTLPAFYAGLLQKQYNTWLKSKYPTQAALETAWLGESVPPGENLLKNATLTDTVLKTDAWHLEQHAGCRAVLEIKSYRDRPGLAVRPEETDGTNWHLQLNQRQLTLQKGMVYTVEFDAAAPAPRPLNVGVGQAHEPWGNLGLSQTFTLEPEWKTWRTSFTATDDDTNARISFAFGDDAGPFYLANVSLRPGVQYALGTGESLDGGGVRLFGEVESPQRKIDRMVFLAETEKAYFDGMKAFIQNDLGCKAMVTGTIVFGPLGLYAQSDMDFIDSHAYWQHPRFPNRPWDGGDWLVEQKAMSDNPPGTLFGMAAERLAGKPFTVTEYNHPAPLDSQTECVPMIASFAAAQDWDGVWLYTYSHAGDSWDRQHLNSFFDIDTNPAKWGFMPAGALIFRDSLFPSHKFKTVHSFAEVGKPLLAALAESHLWHDRNMPAVFAEDHLGYLHSVMMQTFEPVAENADRHYRQIALTDLPGTWWKEGLFFVKNHNAWALAGHIQRGAETISQSAYPFRIESPAWAAVTLTPLDGKDLHQSRRILITACGRCENTGMAFSPDRGTVGRNWGEAPVRIEPVEGEIRLRKTPIFRDGVMTCRILNPDGTVKQTIDCQDHIIPLKAEYGTMWYLVERTAAD
jgi:hypothetical protein